MGHPPYYKLEEVNRMTLPQIMAALAAGRPAARHTSFATFEDLARYRGRL